MNLYGSLHSPSAKATPPAEYRIIKTDNALVGMSIEMNEW